MLFPETMQAGPSSDRLQDHWHHHVQRAAVHDTLIETGKVGSSSTLASLPSAGPHTPPTALGFVELPAVSRGPAFSEFFPWIKEDWNGESMVNTSSMPSPPQSEAQPQLKVAIPDAHPGQPSALHSVATPSHSSAKSSPETMLLNKLRHRPLPKIPTEPPGKTNGPLSPPESSQISAQTPLVFPTPMRPSPSANLFTPSPPMDAARVDAAPSEASSPRHAVPGSPPRPLPMPLPQIPATVVNERSFSAGSIPTMSGQPQLTSSGPDRVEDTGSKSDQRAYDNLSVPGKDHESLYEEDSEVGQAYSGIDGDEPPGMRITRSHSREPTQEGLENLISAYRRSSQRSSAGAHGLANKRHTFNFDETTPRTMVAGSERQAPSNMRYSIFADSKLPGYRLDRDGGNDISSKEMILARTPRQVVGWKAVLMHTDKLGETGKSGLLRKEKYKSKVLGKNLYEVRQEALKNSYDFREGSGILATMHSGHRLFKTDWDIIVKDGRRLSWRMSKAELALYLLPGDVKVAEFRRAIPTSVALTAADDTESRIGSIELMIPSPSAVHGHSRSQSYAGPDEAGRAGIDVNLVIASLLAVFAARHGHANVKAAFEETHTRLGKMLQQEQEAAEDFEDYMQRLPRPGFTKEVDSVLSDTTDEDAVIEPMGPLRGRHAMARQEDERRPREAEKTGRASGKVGRRQSSWMSFGGQDNRRRSEVESTDLKLTPAQVVAMSYRQKEGSED